MNDSQLLDWCAGRGVTVRPSQRMKVGEDWFTVHAVQVDAYAGHGENLREALQDAYATYQHFNPKGILQ